jgi:hypothetical protein
VESYAHENNSHFPIFRKMNTLQRVSREFSFALYVISKNVCAGKQADIRGLHLTNKGNFLLD